MNRQAPCRHEYPCEHGIMAYREDSCRCTICVQAVTIRYAPAHQFIRATGTIRRLQALHAIGYTFDELEQHLGRPIDLDMITESAEASVTVGYARAVIALYDRLSMRPQTGPRADTIRQAAMMRGWAAPLAWDDDWIDDPARKPTGIRTPEYERIRPRSENDTKKRRSLLDMDELEALIRQGVGVERILEMTGTKADALFRRLERNHRGDLIRMLPITRRGYYQNSGAVPAGHSRIPA